MTSLNQQLDIERERINAIDARILNMLENRFLVAERIGKIKKELKMQIFQPQREKEILEAIRSSCTNSEFIVPIFQTIMQQSRKLQEALICKSA